MNLSRQVRNKQALIIVLNGTPSFDPEVSDLGFSPVRWDMGDGTLLPDATTFTHVYGDTSIYTVVSYKRLMNQYRSIQVFSDDLISVDMHSLTGMGGATSGVILLSSNPNLTAITWPVNQDSSTGNLTQVKAENCNLTGAIEIAGLTRITGSLWFYNNDNMTSFTLSAVQTMGSLTSVQFQSCNTLSTIDLTGAVNMRSLFNCSACSNLTSIIFPNNVGVSTGLVTSMQMYQCPNLTSIDLSNYENTWGNFSVRQSTSLTTIIFPPAGALSPITEFRAEQADLTGLLDLSDFVTASGSIGMRMQQNSNLTSFLPPLATGGDSVSLFWIYSCDLTGVMNLSLIEILRNSILFHSNSNLTGVTFFGTPHAQAVSNLQGYDCDLTGNLDVSMFQALGGNFNVHNNPNLTSITNPTSAGVFTDYYAHDCDLTGTLDVSNLSGLGDDFRVYGNSALTSISAPTSALAFNVFYAYNCDLTAILNLTGLTGGFKNFNINNNPNLTGITFDAGMVMTSNGTAFQAQDCDITGTLDISMFNNLGALLWLFGNANLSVVNFPTSTPDTETADSHPCGNRRRNGHHQIPRSDARRRLS